MSSCQSRSNFGLCGILSWATIPALSVGTAYVTAKIKAPVMLFCNEISQIGFKALEPFMSQNSTQFINHTCGQILNVTIPTANFCADVKVQGLGVVEALLDKDLTDWISLACNYTLDYADEVIRVCNETNEIGIPAFEKIGPYLVKDDIVLQACSIFDSSSLILIKTCGVVGGLATVFFVYRLFTSCQTKPCLNTACISEKRALLIKSYKLGALLDKSLNVIQDNIEDDEKKSKAIEAKLKRFPGFILRD